MSDFSTDIVADLQNVINPSELFFKAKTQEPNNIIDITFG